MWSGSANAHSAAGVIATAKRGLRAWRIVVWRLRCAESSMAEIERMLGLGRRLYRGFTVKPFPRAVGQTPRLYTGLYGDQAASASRAGLVQAATKRSAHRKKRPRRPMVEMMLHQDASTHAWLAGDAGKHDLVVTMDDATSAIYSMFLVDEEGTASSLRGVREVVAVRPVLFTLY